MDYIENVIIGGGQAGLATSYFLAKEGREHIIFEQTEKAANVWSNERWDSFTLSTPNWTVRIPGVELDNKNRDEFMPRDEIVKLFEEYVNRFQLPVKYNTKVTSVEKNDNGYIVHTNDRDYKAKNVVIATGFWQQPRVSDFASGSHPGVIHLHSTKYRNPKGLPPGAVLVVGSGQSGCQIAEELYMSGRKVFLSTGTAGRIPRRYRGKDSIDWLEIINFFDLTPEQLPPGQGKFDTIPHITGANGGHTINLHQFARDGIILLGHLKGIEKQKIFIAPSLHNNLRKADKEDQEFRDMIDGFIQENQMDAPPEDIPEMLDGFSQPIIEELDLKDENINSVIWSGGYSYDFSMIRLPVLDSDRYPIQNRGVSSFPGLYFVGIPWMPSYRSGFLLGAGDSAKYVVSNILEGKTDSMHEAV